jgi:hypothetical protein
VNRLPAVSCSLTNATVGPSIPADDPVETRGRPNAQILCAERRSGRIDGDAVGRRAKSSSRASAATRR